MILHRFYDDSLAQASWLIGCEGGQTAIVVDPNRDADQYLRVAERKGLRITHVAETHIHADFVSGTRELAARTGAQMLLSAHGGAEWSYGFADAPGVQLLSDGDEVTLGKVRLKAVHTPGHTPEHLCFLVTDGAASDEPLGLISGDFVFVGDVGRPDLLEKATGAAGTMEQGARDLWASLQRLRPLPDHLQIWPGHGAGSACGKSLGALPTSTLGYERRAGWAFGVASQEEFVAQVLADQPEPPRYFARMKAVNRAGPTLLGELPRPPQLAPETLRSRESDSDRARRPSADLRIDLRGRDAFASAHLPGSLSLPLRYSFATWAGWLLPPDRDLVLLAERADQADEAARLLALIGLDRVIGWVDVHAALARGAREAAPAVGAADAHALRARGPVLTLDVRAQAEWDGGHLPGAVHAHLGTLPDRLDELPRDRPVLVYCRSGARSAIAQSLLLRAGFPTVLNLEGGWIAWTRAGLPVARPEVAASG